MSLILGRSGSVLGLAGVLFGLFLGERRWKAEQARLTADECTKRQEEFIRNERRAYQGLWQVAARKQEEMRGALDSLTPERFSGLLADVNAYMLQEGSISNGTTGC